MCVPIDIVGCCSAEGIPEYICLGEHGYDQLGH